ncbi:abl interactor 2-like isoform X1 [Lineus longissimus]|uniref:abl interactor 2-like isoform X1 n=1 Tax=Lineus longissimus TaxID=88925 RepID=UPI002B4DE81C
MASAELVQLMDQDIPEGRKHLQESYNNLEKVAQYCQENYLQAKDKRHALEETKSFTTQSLASVAYQINTLATNFLHMLDLQQTQLAEMESSINHLSQVVSIHKEKVARREIGVITTNKTTMRPPGMKSLGIIFPEAPERPIKYVRKSIDYAQLDTVGHGVQVAQPTPQNPRQSIQVNRHERRSSSISSSSSVSSGQSSQRQGQQGPPQQPPSQRPPTPPQNQPRLGGSLGRTSGHYRALGPPVVPPSVPSHYAPNYPMAIPQNQMPPPQQYQQPPPQYAANPQRERKGSGLGYAALSQLPPMGPPMVPPPAPPQGAPPMGVAQPISQAHPPVTSIQSPPSQQMMPPSMHMQARHSQLQQQQQMSQASTMSTESYIDSLPPPPSDLDVHQPGNASPPLPPPPTHGGVMPPVRSSMPSKRNMAPQTGMMPPPYSMQMQMQTQSLEPGAMFSMPTMRNHAPPRHQTAYYDQYTEDYEQKLEEQGPGPELSDDGVPANYVEKVVAIYDYVKDKDDELSFSENAIIYVMKKNDDGWWEGQMDGVTGLFPGNYVEPLI